MVFINQALCAQNFLNEFFYNWYANILGAVGCSFRYGLVLRPSPVIVCAWYAFVYNEEVRIESMQQ